MSFTDQFDARMEAVEAKPLEFKPPFQDSLDILGRTIAALQAKYKILDALNNDAIEAAKAAMRFPNK